MEMSLADIIGLLVRVCILSTVFAIGLNATREDVAYLLHKPQLLVRSLLGDVRANAADCRAAGARSSMRLCQSKLRCY